jgi:hypothetical protein
MVEEQPNNYPVSLNHVCKIGLKCPRWSIPTVLHGIRARSGKKLCSVRYGILSRKPKAGCPKSVNSEK